MTAAAAHVIAGLEASVVVYLAGNAAERQALQGSAPGWRRWRTPEQLRALHEAGHAIAQWARGDSRHRRESRSQSRTVCPQRAGWRQAEALGHSEAVAHGGHRGARCCHWPP